MISYFDNSEQFEACQIIEGEFRAGGLQERRLAWLLCYCRGVWLPERIQMSMWFIIALYVALTIAPVAQDRFTISLQGDKNVMECVRQADGQWTMQLPLRSENPKHEKGFVSLGGTHLVMTSRPQKERSDDEYAVDMKEILEAASAVDWSKAGKLTLKNGGGTVLLKRDAHSVTLFYDRFPAPVIIRWEKKPNSLPASP